MKKALTSLFLLSIFFRFPVNAHAQACEFGDGFSTFAGVCTPAISCTRPAYDFGYSDDCPALDVCCLDFVRVDIAPCEAGGAVGTCQPDSECLGPVLTPLDSPSCATSNLSCCVLTSSIPPDSPPGGSSGSYAPPEAFNIKATLFADHDGISQIDSPYAFISSILPNIYTISGVLLLIYAVFGGFAMVTSAGSPDGTGKGQQIITNAIIGFIIIFASYWIIQIIETLTGVQILSFVN